MFEREPIVRVGIIEAPRVRYIYKGVEHEAVWSPDFQEIYLPAGPFTLCDVTIGKQFHWEQQEDQTFVGALRIIAVPKLCIPKQDRSLQSERAGGEAEGYLIAINEVPLEDYLASVISSEMAATNSLELLKAHAIISRSWVMLKVVGEREKVRGKREEVEGEREEVRGNREEDSPSAEQTGTGLSSSAEHLTSSLRTLPPESSVPVCSADGDLLKWWDHDDHTLYDVCADDHCQRYQGITRQVSPLVAEAIRQTRGMVLVDADGAVCDARFFKACGGHTERFSACWQDRDFHYLQPTADPYCAPDFIATLPGGMDGVMRQVLNSYDRSTVDYHEWTERYTAAELSALIDRRLHEVFPAAPPLGRITALEPLERGASGRIVRLRIVGTTGRIVIGKELLIRKVLSESHLKSSWFDVETQQSDGSPHPDTFVLHGHGWGHGVGLCQIGAAAMSIAGFSHAEILAHYFHGSKISSIY